MLLTADAAVPARLALFADLTAGSIIDPGLALLATSQKTPGGGNILRSEGADSGGLFREGGGLFCKGRDGNQKQGSGKQRAHERFSNGMAAYAQIGRFAKLEAGQHVVSEAPVSFAGHQGTQIGAWPPPCDARTDN
ncbi:hypothetical protein [Paracoccus niistensis]|uniref:Uncharacterized protein n=1 Tax=Paracoccus niistensis TaxID=632935 RepID=A0ABV6I1G2_9RHOB